jgi:hypothetical protein
MNDIKNAMLYIPLSILNIRRTITVIRNTTGRLKAKGVNN